MHIFIFNWLIGFIFGVAFIADPVKFLTLISTISLWLLYDNVFITLGVLIQAVW